MPERGKVFEAGRDKPCPGCGSTELVTVAEQNQFCANCGFVVRDDRSPPTEQPSDEDDVDQIEVRWEDLYAVSDSTEARLRDVFATLYALASEFGVGAKTHEHAAETLAEVVKANLLDGRKTESIVGAVLLSSSRECREPIPHRLVEKHVGAKGNYLSRLLREIEEEIGRTPTQTAPSHFLAFLSSRLGSDEKTIARAESILETSVDTGCYLGKNPVGFAAAALYLAHEEEYTQKQIANEAGVSTETVRVRLGDLRTAGVR
ncbi:hypothetical protein C5B90_14080 [Haloferax sp. Atlit-12N]|uniref:sigma factor-like helix-turn-helix DNA-binding protein n=1 Tax=Haloferax sp. Atlit-12N TaxID=2077203 RepID=UPI000E267710|nr:transcription initiation factor IIB family protein [Haloferax sp. Atlit-12N]RDZ64214.1 hypothetical protein C5B90_14080 [Haloferax sp. Atlit-12N]